jgi:hypothetical protein
MFLSLSCGILRSSLNRLSVNRGPNDAVREPRLSHPRRRIRGRSRTGTHTGPRCAGVRYGSEADVRASHRVSPLGFRTFPLALWHFGVENDAGATYPRPGSTLRARCLAFSLARAQL